MVGGEQLEHPLTHGVIFFIHDCVASAVDQDFWINHSRERDNLAVELECVAHRQTVRMAGNRNDIFGSKHTSLLQDLPADLGQREALTRRVIPLQPAGSLNGLQGYSANARLL